MYQYFSAEAKQIIKRCHQLAIANHEYIVGSEYLLLALYLEKNSSCNILLHELSITEEMIRSTIDKIVLFRKSIPGLIIYTQCLKKIFERAVLLRNLTQSTLVYEEHLFYSLLETKPSIAQVVLEKLNVDGDLLREEIIDVMDWDLDEPEPDTPITKFNFVSNLTATISQNPNPPLVMRDEIINRILNILSKKFKRNVLLIGNAGVGKTAIVEGLAAYFLRTNQEKQILSLNLNALVSGTKYRGDFEKRIELFLNEVKNNSNYILFIDELHNVVSQTNTDAGVDLANIIKPALSRDEISLIGATTLNEYYKFLAKDSAFTRRFVHIFVDEPSLEDTKKILRQIKSYYADFHQIEVPDTICDYICQVSDTMITNNHFPDKAIDLLDEACALCKNLGEQVLKKHHVNRLLNQIKHNLFNDQIKAKLNQYAFLSKNFLRYYNAIKTDYRPITSIICIDANDDHINTIIKDLQSIFNIKSEATKIIDLSNYTEQHSISNLLGAPPGYIGYDNENTLTKFVNKYHKSIIVFKNLDDILLSIKSLLKQILEVGIVEDLSSSKIFFSNSIIIGTVKGEQKKIGYLASQTQPKIKTTLDLPFEHRITQYHINPQDSKINYQSAFENYLQSLAILNGKIDLDDLYDFPSNHWDENLFQSFENTIAKIWFEDLQQTIKITYNQEQREFVIIQRK